MEAFTRNIYFFLLIILLPACTSEQVRTKVYFQKKAPANYIELRGNGSVLIHQDKVNIIGTYESDSLLLTLIFFGGRAIRLEIAADSLIDEEGDRWVLWKNGESGWAYEHSEDMKKIKAVKAAQILKDAIINDLNSLASHAYQYRIRPESMGGGAGSYIGYQIPERLASNENAIYTCTVEPSIIKITAIANNNRKNGIKVQLDSDGQLNQWQYFGDFK